MRLLCGHLFALIILLSLIMTAVGSRRDKRSYSPSSEFRHWRRAYRRAYRHGYGGFYGYNQPYYGYNQYYQTYYYPTYVGWGR
ncbi:unnamed protein product [Nippostrongylus brasiliensis]|uniref:Uncharacterized protein n=1 Tax=Nippostrongylus brasiliensis TaxID=27835 RepID=A0A0N4Y5Q5_NIPBR|nr:hypothetical protein Q1695_003753 [Nippostrongylus brasiliensis]VDL74942.1 unnamed protein product [Nippostrongylus brasiliensis]